MSRRNQARRRRSYGRRQHAVRERRPEIDARWDGDSRVDGAETADWGAGETADAQSAPGGESYTTYDR